MELGVNKLRSIMPGRSSNLNRDLHTIALITSSIPHVDSYNLVRFLTDAIYLNNLTVMIPGLEWSSLQVLVP
jgi:hypothetical protein